jgi:hypothetical protein
MNSHIQQFPPQKERASRSTEVRRDRGANNKRLPRTEAAPVAFSAPIAAHTPEAHETLNPTRDGEGVPKVVRGGQLPGCLPPGFDLDSFLTKQEFCIWRRVTMQWLKPRLCLMHGVVRETRQSVRIHPRTYLELSVKSKRTT